MDLWSLGLYVDKDGGINKIEPLLKNPFEFFVYVEKDASHMLKASVRFYL
jgi:hypothetical protein